MKSLSINTSFFVLAQTMNIPLTFEHLTPGSYVKHVYFSTTPLFVIMDSAKRSMFILRLTDKKKVGQIKFCNLYAPKATKFPRLTLKITCWRKKRQPRIKINHAKVSRSGCGLCFYNAYPIYKFLSIWMYLPQSIILVECLFGKLNSWANANAIANSTRYAKRTQVGVN